LHSFANELLRMNGDKKPVDKT
jgi:hypothetical protein